MRINFSVRDGRFFLGLLLTSYFACFLAPEAGHCAVPKNAVVPMGSKLKLVSGKGVGTLGQTVEKFDVTIIQFWASWCVGCGEMMAELAKRSKQDTSIGYASVSIDEDIATAQRYFKAKSDEIKAAIPNALLDEAGEKIATPLKITTLPYVRKAAVRSSANQSEPPPTWLLPKAVDHASNSA